MYQFKKLLCAAALSALVGSADASSVKVNVTNIDEHKGTLIVVLFNDETAFDDGGKALKISKVSVDSAQHSLIFDDIEPGSYAVKLFHDANDNGKLDQNFLGIPSEGYGFSNNGGTFGPSSFAESAFSVADATEINIKLR